MYALKLELKLNNKERSLLAGCAGFARFTYNFGLSMITQSWGFEGIVAVDAKRLAVIEKVFTNLVLTNPEYAWMKQHPSAIYSSAFRNLGKAKREMAKKSIRIPSNEDLRPVIGHWSLVMSIANRQWLMANCKKRQTNSEARDISLLAMGN